MAKPEKSYKVFQSRCHYTTCLCCRSWFVRRGFPQVLSQTSKSFHCSKSCNLSRFKLCSSSFQNRRPTDSVTLSFGWKLKLQKGRTEILDPDTSIEVPWKTDMDYMLLIICWFSMDLFPTLLG